MDYLCTECWQKDDWKWHLRMLQLEKIRCVKCGWKLTIKNYDGSNTWESQLGVKCPCCGYRFQLGHREYSGEPY